ncbi:hypothetical protein PG614_05885 [Riemerella anatipestifer]|nr:hypothetical protein [Riemerella anatipestifer]MDY3532997.1 hypothetical protein [Riemerella anatipestifer]MDY3535470.1 hypothetical protein [Riemerella anatipestifer]
MKTKTTKLSVLAFLGLGLVAYGQDYSGKIGINYNKPNATLEIKGKSSNTDKTLEGLIIPNVSKNKAYLMTTNTEMPLKESTLIYVDNISDYTTSPVDTKVADITENGYYFWNGTKWVKSAGSTSGNIDSGIWKKLSNGNYTLMNVETEAKIENFYTPVGANWNISKNIQAETYGIDRVNSDNTKVSNDIANRSDVFSKNEANSMFYNRAYASEIKKISPDRVRRLMTNELVLDNSTIAVANSDAFTSGSDRLRIPQENSNNYNDVYVRTNVVTHAGTGTINSLDSGSNQMIIKGNVLTAKVLSSSSSITKGNIKNHYGIANTISLQENGTATIENMYLNSSSITKHNSFAGTIDKLMGYYLNMNNTITPINQYGLYMENVAGATNDNYAIYTNAGKVHFGDEVNVAGTLTATSIKGSNGATIFPDYVFQKYYTGTSSLKADYSFKTLRQVEDFVKTNGHLPGYKSAAEIKKQGYIDLMATQLTNVEKIEELYLHLLEKDKEVKELKAKNEELETRLEQIEKLLK